MKFVIVGYGRVGIRTARILREEGHEVIVVENDPDKIDRARDEGFETIEGDGAEDATFEGIDLSTVDAVGGLTGDLNVNFAACMIGKHHGCRTVLRIDEDYREDIYQKYADDVDEVIYPERLGAAGAKTALLGGDFNVLSDLTEKLQLSVFTIGDGSGAVGSRVSEVELPESARIYAHGRQHESLTIPLPGTTLESGDQVAVIVDAESVSDVKTALAG
ncbi:trk system potassium uptake protein TrkA [Natronoarchaeum philippinense]|uniref:Trk system potassium uptake protein TrkA n=1 Tax=Natronoarchaeum philippinense TaxID=558529 RepID=A0A285P829_NATPI|nr:TrkA family potassium uptake protein [Natronoarchaeum philippinense]SNZ17417.1 trk system potassium uptake protein TrkA [Natronoarchaeum philippinense]